MREPAQRAVHVLGGVVIVMEMNLYFAKSFATETCQRIDMQWLVLIDRIEKRMTRRKPVTISKLTKQLRVFHQPRCDTLVCNIKRGSSPGWLKMVCDTQ